MESLPISTVPTATVRDLAVGSGAGEFALDAQLPVGAEAFIAALLAQGANGLVPVAAGATVGVATEAAAGNAAPVALQGLPLARPALATLTRPTLRSAASEGAAVDAASDGEAAVSGTGSGRFEALVIDMRAALAPQAEESGRARAALTRGDPATGNPLTAPALAAFGEGLANLDGAAAAPEAPATHGVDAVHSARPATAAAGPAAGAAHPGPLPLARPDLLVERLEQHVSLLIAQNVQQANIAVSPPELGPVEVRVVVVGDEAKVQLAAPHAATREALEEALPRLRAAFAEDGLSLGHAGVFAEMPQQHQAGGGQDFLPGSAAAAGEEGAPEVLPAPIRVVQVGLVDAFV